MSGIQGSTARRNTEQQVGYLRIKVNFNDAGIAAGVKKQWLPQGAVIVGTDVVVSTAFNAVTTNTISVGTVGDTATNIVNAQTVAAAGITANLAPSAAALGPLAADKQVVVTYTQTGGAATAGVATVVIKYVCDNDL